MSEPSEAACVDTHCDGCKHLITQTTIMRVCCNYYLDTGERRGCPAGEGCTRYDDTDRDAYRRNRAKAILGEST